MDAVSAVLDGMVGCAVSAQLILAVAAADLLLGEANARRALAPPPLVTALGQRLRDLEQQAAADGERTAGLLFQVADALADASRDRDRAAAAEAHLTAFTTALAAGNFRPAAPGEPA